MAKARLALLPWFAAYAGQLEVVQALAARKALIPMAILDAENKHGFTPMALAAYAGQLEMVRDLAGRTANLDAENQHGFTPMTLAAYAGQLDLLQWL